MPKLPYMQFYVDDWKSELGLTLCSLNARGCWIEVLGTMHQAGQTGVLAGTADQLSRVCRCSPSELVQAFQELRSTGVAEIDLHDGVYTIVCRRMRRESKERAQASERQKRFQLAKSLYVNGNETEEKTEYKRKINAGESETDNNIEKKKCKEEKFVVPSIGEIEHYCAERNNAIDPKKFFDFYQAKGWMIGKNRMKDWKAAVRTWEGNSRQPGAPPPGVNGLMDIKIRR